MDYQAFGEQISSGIGQRTTSGYTATDTLRNRYALTERDEATGLDDTWFRKLENRAGRWTSPDPYNGSANIGNGQSWNRYSYVENQPTNYVDPSGLLVLSWVCWDVTTYSHAANDPLHTRTDTTTQCSAIWVGGGDGGGGYNVSGGLGGTPNNIEETDCEKLVRITTEIARNAKNAADFADQMAKRFLGIEGASINQFRRASHIGSREFGASGFKAQFQDMSNQVRHFTAGLIAGYLFGAVGGYGAMGINESYGFGMVDPADDQKADIALNSVSTSLGARVVDPQPQRTEERGGGSRAEMRRTITIPAHPGYTDIADRIRSQLCE